MRILLDQSVPRPILRYLSAHDAKTAYDQGWSTHKNGDLLRAAEEAGFEVFLTADKNIPYQHNLSARSIAIVVLDESAWPHIAEQAERVVTVLESCRPGEYKTVSFR